MQLLCIGLNHKTAPVEVRERFAVHSAKLGESAAGIVQTSGAGEAVVLSTCNRTEFYLAAETPAAAKQRLFDHLAETIGSDSLPTEHWYHRERMDAAEHLCRVVSGLDSMMLGETEIFGQVKQAYQAALDSSATGCSSALSVLVKKSARKPAYRKVPPLLAVWLWTLRRKSLENFPNPKS
jgi:glutamyl-tRNA reductase